MGGQERPFEENLEILKFHENPIWRHQMASFQCPEFKSVNENHPRIQYTFDTMTMQYAPLKICEMTTDAQSKSPTASKTTLTIRFAVKNHAGK